MMLSLKENERLFKRRRIGYNGKKVTGWFGKDLQIV
jgi:hypothetical protein